MEPCSLWNVFCHRIHFPPSIWLDWRSVGTSDLHLFSVHLFHHSWVFSVYCLKTNSKLWSFQSEFTFLFIGMTEISYLTEETSPTINSLEYQRIFCNDCLNRNSHLFTLLSGPSGWWGCLVLKRMVSLIQFSSVQFSRSVVSDSVTP